MQLKLSVTNHMNNIAAFAARFAIPIWWFIWVVKSIQSGYKPGFVLLIPGEHLPYPWFKVLQVCLLLTCEVVILYAILQPDLLKWSLARTLIAFILFFGIAALQNKEAWSDRPGYAYIPGEFAISTAGILAVWFVVTLVHELFIWHSRRQAHHNAA